MAWLLLLFLPPLVVALAYGRAPLFLWGGAILVWWLALAITAAFPVWVTVVVALAWCGVVFLLGHRPTRKRLITVPIFKAFAKALPQMSQTERDALEAGTVWWEGELFRGNPDWQKFLSYPWPKLTPEEQAFLENETEELCRMVDDWECSLKKDMPDAVWQFIKERGSWG